MAVLKAGQTPRPDDGYDMAPFEGSMAQAIEEAFEDEWTAVKKTPMVQQGLEDRRILFAAIARGVLKHLKDRANSGLHVRSPFIDIAPMSDATPCAVTPVSTAIRAMVFPSLDQEHGNKALPGSEHRCSTSPVPSAAFQ